jgi:hypothetical protein
VAVGACLSRAPAPRLPLNDGVPSRSADALFGLLLPFWQLVLGVVVLVFVLGTAVRLAGRGRSRMNTALIITGSALLGLMTIGAIAASR